MRSWRYKNFPIARPPLERPSVHARYPAYGGILSWNEKISERELPGLGGLGVVFGWFYLFEEVELILFLQLVIYEDPCAVAILVDLAFAFVLAAARPVQKRFRAARERADEAGELQNTFPARRTSLQKCPACVDRAHEECVAPDVDRFLDAQVLFH